VTFYPFIALFRLKGEEKMSSESREKGQREGEKRKERGKEKKK
jgi:hypothetical protein